MYKSFALTTSLCAVLAACTSSDSSVNAEPLLGTCGGTECSHGSVVALTLDHPDGLTFADGEQLILTLYGYDRYLADAAASPIAYYEDTLFELPLTLAINVPNDPHTLIDQGNGAVTQEDAEFYFAVGNDQGCGVLQENFQLSEPQFFESEIPSAVTLSLTDVCRD